MIILGIETSCDETAVALVEDGRKILVNLVSSQLEAHRRYGGVVPELASRLHLQVIFPLIAKAYQEAGIGPEKVGAVAFTQGPGLIGSLLVGASVAKALAYSYGLPLIGVNHLKAHLYAPCIDGAELEFPLVALLVSGGHTLLVRAASPVESEIIGGTRDDAAGEAFDKVAFLLGLDYPGGPSIEKAAKKGDPAAFKFPRGMLKSGDLDFSFSGIKTAVYYTLKKLKEEGKSFRVENIAASFQEAVVEVLVAKLKEAVATSGARTIILGGGVVCNKPLRSRVEETFPPDRYRLLIPPPSLCSDNGAMIAGLAFQLLEKGRTTDFSADADPNLPWGTALL